MSSESRQDLSFPNFSSLSKPSSGSRDASRGISSSTPKGDIQDFNIYLPSDGSSSEFNISIQPRDQLSSSMSSSSSSSIRKGKKIIRDSSGTSQEGVMASRTPSQESMSSQSGYDIPMDELSRAPSPSSSSSTSSVPASSSSSTSSVPASSSSSTASVPAPSSSSSSSTASVAAPSSSSTASVPAPSSSSSSSTASVPAPSSSSSESNQDIPYIQAPSSEEILTSDSEGKREGSESRYQEVLQERLLSNMSPQQQEQQKEFIFNPDMSRKSKKQQNIFLKEKGNAEKESIEHFNKQFSNLGLKNSELEGEGSPSPSPSPSPDELETQTSENAYNFLYPTLDDPQFNIKIASKREFADTKYDGTIQNSLEAIKKHSNKMCNADFELSPHQLFVRNFLSFQTPYNSLLLYHGLGTGKTCSAITICEEMRDYLVQIGISTSQKIIIVASPNVQQNFKLQLFDKNKLKLIDGIWNIRSCTGNKYLKEINPMNMKGMEEEKVVSEIKKIIRRSYHFLGYDQFANLIEKTSTVSDDVVDKSHRTKIIMQKLKVVFGNSLIVIDEFHNIKSTDEKSGTRAVAEQLEKLVKFGPFLMTRLLLLTGTPMYNSYREIIWLLNIMRLNDGRAEIDIRDVFNSNPDDGIFVETADGPGQITETGRENLRRFSTGYVSYIRGENPYTFPFRIYPDEFSPKHTFSGVDAGVDASDESEELREKKKINYEIPNMQINGLRIPEHRKLSRMQDKIYLTGASDYQQNVYSYIIRQFLALKRDEMRTIEESVSVGINILRSPIEALNISYPSDDFTPEMSNFNYDIRLLVGKYGLRNIMNYSEDTKTGFEYKDDKPHIFSRELIGNYSSKIKSICDNIYKSEGIILIYSFYIEGGVIPMALALESMGFTRYGTKARTLFNSPPDGVRPIDGITSRQRSEMRANETFFPAKYVVISGEAALSPDNIGDVKAASNEANFDGRFVKVIIISKSGTEGLDFKNIRQVHILEPWYNMNRLDQIIGRAVRNFSHKDLPFEKRNVQIFMYGTLLEDSEEEAADLYVYRVAEYKAIQIGRVSRILKETAVDCIINHDQTNFTQEKLNANIDEEITQELSTGIVINNFKIGDAPYSAACDYMATCDYTCNPDKKIDEDDLNQDTYNEKFIMTNSEKILQKIRMLMKENFFYKKDVLLNLIRTPKEYPYIQIFAALTHLIEDRNEIIIDKYDRTGYLINIDEYYLFQPSELRDKNLSIFDRSVPIDYKHSMVDFKLNQDIIKPVVDMRNIAERVESANVEGKNIIDELKIQYDVAVEFTKGPKVPRGDDDWYKHCGIVMKKLAKSGEPLEELLEFLVHHILELLTFKDKVDIMNYLYSLDKLKENSFEWFSKKYFEDHIITEKKIRAIILYDFNVRKTMILNKDNVWEVAEPEDENEIDSSKEGKKIINFNMDDYLNKSIPNGIIGFIGYKKNSKNYIFKTKDVFLPRDTGASCIEAGKSKTLATLNKIVNNDEAYTKENTKLVKDEDGNVIREAVGENELCVLQEFILRKYNRIEKDDKLWFLTPDMAIHYKIYTPTLK